MKTKTRFLIYPLLLMGVLLMLTNSCKKEGDIFASIQFNPDLTYGTMTDIDGNVYKTITIGTQTWMAENLKTTRYRNGDPIRNIADNSAGENDTTGGYCNILNNSNYTINFGRLYNWFAVNDSRNIAPEGWHVPTDVEWHILMLHLDANAFLDTTAIQDPNDRKGNESFYESQIAGYKLQETGSNHWKADSRFFRSNGKFYDSGDNSKSTNESGFTALPAGLLLINGSFADLGENANLWSSTEYIDSCAWSRCIIGGLVLHIYDSKLGGFSVRCIKDN